MKISQHLFSEFERLIRALPVRERFDRADLLIPSLKLHQEKGVEMYYAPFDAVNSSAAILLLGITPGWTQMEIAFRVARRELELGVPEEEVCRRAKEHASFGGAMRRNLTGMLDELGVPSLLNIESTTALFDSAAALLHTASVIRYPVFVNGHNYTGHNPAMLRNTFLREWIQSMLAPELASVPHALIVPLGNAVSEVLEFLVYRGDISVERCLFGFPHPSGANGHRVCDFSARRQDLAEKVTKYFHGRAEITGPNAGGLRQFPSRTPQAPHVGHTD